MDKVVFWQLTISGTKSFGASPELQKEARKLEEELFRNSSQKLIKTLNKVQSDAQSLLVVFYDKLYFAGKEG